MELLGALTGGTVKEEGAGVVSQQGGEADRRCLQRVSGALGRASCALSAVVCVPSHVASWVALPLVFFTPGSSAGGWDSPFSFSKCRDEKGKQAEEP